MCGHECNLINLQSQAYESDRNLRFFPVRRIPVGHPFRTLFGRYSEMDSSQIRQIGEGLKVVREQTFKPKI
jgi:hypothetical protein